MPYNYYQEYSCYITSSNTDNMIIIINIINIVLCLIVAVICDDQIETSIHTKCEPVYDNERSAKSILAQVNKQKQY